MNTKLNLSQLKPISSLPKNYSALAESSIHDGDVVFLKRNTPYVVLLDFSRWQKLTEIEQKYTEKLALADISQSEQEFQAGEGKLLTSLADL